MQAILESFRPDLIVVSHPNDEHPDHRATSNSTRLALALLRESNPDYHPQVWGYLIHYGYFPQPRGERPNAHLLPPLPLSGEHNRWARLDLTQEELQSKTLALRRYSSQVRLLGSFLFSFARQNEIVVPLPILDLSPVEFDALPLQESGLKALPDLPEPGRESTRRLLVAGTDLIGWKYSRLGDRLFLTADVRGSLVPGIDYRILVKSPVGDTYVYGLKNKQASRGIGFFTAEIDLTELDKPPVLGFMAEVRQGVTLGRTGWYFLILQDWLTELFFV